MFLWQIVSPIKELGKTWAGKTEDFTFTKRLLKKIIKKSLMSKSSLTCYEGLWLKLSADMEIHNCKICTWVFMNGNHYAH